MDYYSKTERILDMCKGKTVLHIGCVGFADLQTSERVSRAKQSLHYALTACANTVGVDYSREAIEYYRKHHVFDNVLPGNAEQLEALKLDAQFDVVVAGDIIEHLTNPGRMLDGIRSVCRPDTLVVITTPHAFGLLTYLRFLTNHFTEGQEHVFTMNSQNIEHMAQRHGFEIVEIATCFQDHATNSSMFKLGRAFFKQFPRLGGTLFVVLRPAAASAAVKKAA